MFYLLRRIPLTDQERAWNILAVRLQVPEAAALIEAWLDVVKYYLKGLQSSVMSSKKAKLYSLVSQMLEADQNTRICVSDLANEISTWKG